MHRTETDSLGSLPIPADSLHGIATLRSQEAFGLPEQPDPALWRAFLLVKKASCLTNAELGHLPAPKAEAITRAIDTLLAEDPQGALFRVNPLAGGAGTSLNLCVNEVIANKALTLLGHPPGSYHIIHPLHDVNLHQSTNDVFPTALRVAALDLLRHLEETLRGLQETIQRKEQEFSGIVRLGRTELQDALPVTLGMQLSAWADAVGRDRWRAFKASERLKTVNLGGTAVGTGFNAPRNYIFRATDILRDLTGLPLCRAENLVDATQNSDPFVEASGTLTATASDLMKIAEDLRLSSSGPHGGIAELILPPLQEGSSIMPGKTNPVIPEFVIQSGLLVHTLHHALATACGLANLELNQYLPLVAWCLLKSLRLLTDAADRLGRLCIAGLRVDTERVRNNLSSPIALLTFLAPRIGHTKAGELYRLHLQTRRDITDLLVETATLSRTELDALLSAASVRRLGFSPDDTP